MAESHKYYYMRLKENFFDDEAMKIMEGLPDGYLYSNILLKMYLASLKTEGRLMLNNVIPYSPQMIASVTGHQVGTVEKALKVFRDLGLVEILDNGAIYMLNIQNFIGQASNEADRKREYERQIAAEKKSRRNVGEISEKKAPEIDIDIKPEIEKEKKAQAPREDPTAALDPAVREAFRDYEQMRVKTKAAMTDKAKALTIDDLKKLASDPETQVAILNQSTMNSWKGLYPLKNEREDRKQSEQPKGTFFAFPQREIDEEDEEALELRLRRKALGKD